MASLVVVPQSVNFDIANGKQLRLVRTAFLAVFIRRSKLAIFLQDYFEKNFDRIAQGEDFEDEVFHLLQDAAAEGWLADVVEKAIEAYPRAIAFKSMVDQWFLFADPSDKKSNITSAILSPPPPSPLNGPTDGHETPGPRPLPSRPILSPSNQTSNLIEELINSVRGPAAAQQWLARLTSMRRRVCRISTQLKSGIWMSTGFLIGSNTVLSIGTIEPPFLDKYSLGKNSIVKFDFEMVDGEIQSGREIPVLTHEFFFGEQNESPSEDKVFSEVSPVRFGLLELSEPEGNQVGELGSARGWFDLSSPASDLTSGEPLFLLHYPAGLYLHMSQGLLLRTENSSRIRYDGMTQFGSGGAPVFNKDFQLVGMHEARSPLGADGKIDKFALRADAIANVLISKGLLPPPWVDESVSQL